ncbi:hypothetical protein [Nonomuraea fuscirosea]|uniref:hypothetical protein n=1 Tax=Nonomuraea fuscirosea TaxID=1291556 RepID=UPI0034270373
MAELVRCAADLGQQEAALDRGHGEVVAAAELAGQRADRTAAHRVLPGTTAVVVRGDRAYVTDGANLKGDDSNLLLAEPRHR